jgi:hypothetical protein
MWLASDCLLWIRWWILGSHEFQGTSDVAEYMVVWRKTQFHEVSHNNWYMLRDVYKFLFKLFININVECPTHGIQFKNMCYAIPHRTLNQSLEITSFNFKTRLNLINELLRVVWSSYAEIADNVEVMPSSFSAVCGLFLWVFVILNEAVCEPMIVK